MIPGDERAAACAGPPCRQPAAQRCIIDELAEHARQGVEVAGRHEPPTFVRHDLGRAAARRRHDRHAREKRLGKDHAERFGSFVRLTEEIDCAHQQRHVTTLAEKSHARFEPESRNVLLQLGEVALLVRPLRRAGNP